ncbi:MAG: ABC transporter ATP-binding protein [Bacteroidaceae bacterium]|nr:ABC transporter ATP-binding protein [Bacteroidaceae bacterium]
MNNHLVEIKNVSAHYGKKQVLTGVSFNVEERDFLGIIGPNGGGKTTLVKILLGLVKPSEGTVTFFHEGKPSSRPRIGYLPQYLSFDHKFPVTVTDVVLSGLLGQRNLFRRFTEDEHKQAHQIISQLELQEFAQAPISQLSGGQRQRVLLGRTLICQPKLIILDEPSTYIDHQHQSELYAILNEINRQCAIILVSHDIGTVLQNVSNIVCVNGHAHFHPVSEVTEDIMENSFGCPFQLVAHGELPHRVLEAH